METLLTEHWLNTRPLLDPWARSLSMREFFSSWPLNNQRHGLRLPVPCILKMYRIPTNLTRADSLTDPRMIHYHLRPTQECSRYCSARSVGPWNYPREYTRQSPPTGQRSARDCHYKIGKASRSPPSHSLQPSGTRFPTICRLHTKLLLRPRL